MRLGAHAIQSLLPLSPFGHLALIKDRIQLGSPEQVGTPDTMLAVACQKLQEVESAWSAHTTANDLPSVRPILIVQVEDRAGEQGHSRTDLNAVLEKLREHIP